jgi:hypothetical protein
MDLSASWESDSCAVTQEFLKILGNPNFHCRVRKSSSLARMVSQIKAACNTLYGPRSLLISSSHQRLDFPSGLSPSDFVINNVHELFFVLIRASFPAPPILLDFVVIIMLGEEYKSRSCSLCSFIPPPVTWSLFGPCVCSAPCSQTASVYVPPWMSESQANL